MQKGSEQFAGEVDHMKARIKGYILIGIAALVSYFLLSNHLIFYGKELQLLKKDSLHLHYTFYSVQEKKPESIMKIDILREAGIGDLLVYWEIITEDEKFNLENKFQYEY